MAGIETNFEFDEVYEEIDGFLESFMEEFTKRVKRRTPVRTGELRVSFDYTVEDNFIEFGSDLDYASFVEWGTPKMAPQGMVSVTCEEAEQIAEMAARKPKRKRKA